MILDNQIRERSFYPVMISCIISSDGMGDAI